jgi:hypothetical protein
MSYVTDISWVMSLLKLPFSDIQYMLKVTLLLHLVRTLITYHYGGSLFVLACFIIQWSILCAEHHTDSNKATKEQWNIIFNPEDRDSMFLWNVWQVYTVPEPRTSPSSSVPWKPHISQWSIKFVQIIEYAVCNAQITHQNFHKVKIWFVWCECTADIISHVTYRLLLGTCWELIQCESCLT